MKTCTVPNPRFGAKRQLVSIYSIYRIYWKPVSAAAMHKICSLGSVDLVWQPCDSFLEIQWSICLVLDIFRIRQTQGLNRPKMPIQWVPAPGIEAPSDAVPGGIDVNGTRIYVARAPHMGSLIPGKWRAACCWVR